jgi:hypothetical protein
MKRTIRFLILPALLVTVTACPASDPYPSHPGYDDPYYGGGYGRDDDYYRRRRWEEKQRREERNLDRERERLERERRELEEERERHEREDRNHHGGSISPPPPRVEHCPSGFSPSERKCTNEERRKGCRDMRLSNGMGCVDR